MQRTRRQHFGQHFLKDTQVIQSIVSSFVATTENSKADLQVAAQAPTQPTPWIEIGPGKGALTLPVFEVLQQITQARPAFYIFEKDQKILDWWNRQLHPKSGDGTNAESLAEKIAFEPAPVFVAGDFNRTGPEFFEKLRSSATGSPKKVHVLSNLPYSVSVHILNTLDQYRDCIASMTLMFQKEVGDRISAKPSTSDRGSLSVWMQTHWDIQEKLLVKPRAFNPPPKVDSCVLEFQPRTSPLITFKPQDPKGAQFESLLAKAFSQRRKMLRSTFKGSPALLEALQLSQIPPELRPETLTHTQWDALYQNWRKSI